MSEEKKALSKKTIKKAYMDWMFWNLSVQNFERMEGPAIVKMLADVREELYPNNPEAQKEMLERHTIFFNTEPYLGCIVPGIVLGMEHEMAQGGDVQPEFINAIKTALMGPFAGIGDSLLPGTLIPILLSISLGLCENGEILGPLFYIIVFLGIMFPLTWFLFSYGVKAVCDIPVIGINKKFGSGDPLDEIFTTPTFESAKAVIEAGCDVLALDCTIRECRPFEELSELLRQVKKAYPDIPIMADLATLDEAERVADTGYVDIISTTLAGYTRASLEGKTDRPNIPLIREIKKKVSLPVNAESRIWELRDLEEALEAGADMVSIGSAVTRPHLITERFANCNKRFRNR